VVKRGRLLIPVAIVLGIGLALAVADAWHGSRRPQEVEVALLSDLRLRPDLSGFERAFEGWEKIVTKGVHEDGTVNPSGIEEWFRSGEMLVDRHRVDVKLFRNRERAEASFNFKTGTLWPGGDAEGNVYGGSGADRYCLSEVREVESSCIWFLPRGTGNYTSHLLFLKGRVVIDFYESSREPRAEKDELVASLAARLEPFRAVR
jgi:hypothetical protein